MATPYQQLMPALYEWSQLQAMSRLSRVLHEFANHAIVTADDTLVDILLPDMVTTDANKSRLIAVLVLCRTLHQQLKSGLEGVRNSDKNEHNLSHCIKWSYNGLNVVIAAMASICHLTPDTQLFLRPTSDSFLFVDIFYKLKQLKVLSFLAIHPQPPIELLSAIINETFLWTEPTRLNTSVMQLHSRLVAQYSNCINDHKSLQSYITHDFLFELNECLSFVCLNFQSFINYLTETIGKTQIELIVDNWSPTVVSSLELNFQNNCTDLVNFLDKVLTDRSLLSDQQFLIMFVENCLNQSLDKTRLNKVEL